MPPAWWVVTPDWFTLITQSVNFASGDCEKIPPPSPTVTPAGAVPIVLLLRVTPVSVRVDVSVLKMPPPYPLWAKLQFPAFPVLLPSTEQLVIIRLPAL